MSMLPACSPHGGHSNTSLVGDVANGSTPDSAVWWRPGDFLVFTLQANKRAKLPNYFPPLVPPSFCCLQVGTLCLGMQ